jgi:hypothetical protein
MDLAFYGVGLKATVRSAPTQAGSAMMRGGDIP